MPGYNSRRAAGQRDAGLRRVGRITWRAAAAGLAGAAVAALAFAQHATAGASTPGTGTPGTSTPATSTPGTSTPGTPAPKTSTHRPRHQHASIVIPARPPQPAAGSGQVTSGGS
ncbi:MAG: hypothetical protein WAL16_06355 [Streptosporangiaceae bacterium]